MPSACIITKMLMQLYMPKGCPYMVYQYRKWAYHSNVRVCSSV